MNRHIKTLLAVFVAFSFLAIKGNAQFYNGHQMSFGKNRVQYDEFTWSYYRLDRYDVFYYEDGRNLAEYTVKYAEQSMSRLERFFGYKIEQRVQFLVFNRLSDFRQSNIGLITGQDEYNIGGTTTINRNKAFLYFEGDFNLFDKQIDAAVSQLLLNELIYGNELLDNVTNSTLINLPVWFTEGLTAYLSKNWDPDTENRVKDGILNDTYTKFNRLTGEDAIYAGHSFWKYVADIYGESVIPSIIYLTSISKSIKSGFLEVLGMSLKSLTNDWAGYYLDMFTAENGYTDPSEDGVILTKPKKNTRYQQTRLSPDGSQLAYVTNSSGL